MGGNKPTPAGNFKEYSIICSDNRVRPYVVYIPETYDKEQATLLVYLHGAVMRDSVNPSPLKSAQRSSLCNLAAEGGYALLFPYADKHASWFNDIGVKMISDEIDQVVEEYQINTNRVFLSGFSDGASGTFYLAMNHPDRFGGFIALNGYPPVASQLGESQCYVDNLKQKPLYVVNTTGDLLYPSAIIEPMIEFMRIRGIDVEFKTPEGNHFLSYLPSETEKIIHFINSSARTIGDSIEWEFSRNETSSIAWISSMTIDTTKERKDWHKDVNLTLIDSSVNFSVNYDPEYIGPGLKVKGYRNEESIAKKMGVLEGDIIIMMEDDTVKSFYTPYFYYFEKRAGDSTQLTIKRENEIITLEGRFAPPHEFFLYNHERASGKIRANISDNIIKIETSRIGELWVDFSKLQYDETTEVKVYLNGMLKANRNFDPSEKLLLRD